jgi:hypothetical protein
VEAEAGDNQEVYAALRHRTKTGALLTMETMLASHLLDASIRRSNVDRFLEVLPTYTRAVVLGSSIMADARARSVADMPTGSSLKPVGTDEWTDPSIREATISAILVFALALVCSGKTETFEELRARVLQTADLSIHPSCNLGRTVNRREA